jgi:guanosine-3',5'-bis(diphosphate) 3'-pyrophosphohydrolase
MTDHPRRPLLEAISFAARAHDGQLRKDGKTPYASHPFRVCLIVRHIFNIDDETTLQAAILHDTIEDTPTDFDDIEQRFGTDVAVLVATLSKDMRQPEHDREIAYCTALAAAPWQVKVSKLADLYDNLLDMRGLSPESRQRTLRRSRRYLAALNTADLPAQARHAHDIVRRLLDELDPPPIA